MKFKLSLVVAMLCSLMGCAGESSDGVEDGDFDATSSEIINGQADNGHPAVVAIRWQVTTAKGTGGSICTGTLVAPRTVLTAGHCVRPEDASMRFSNYEVVFGSNANSATARRLPVASVVPHPRYNPQVFGAFDIGVVLLAADAPVKPIPVAKSLPNLTGRPVTHVGFGHTVSINRETKSGAGGQKFMLTLPVTEHSNITLRTGNGQSGICNGDSGGPALANMNGGEVVVGVHSYIDDVDRCLRNGYSARTDIAYDFIARFL